MPSTALQALWMENMRAGRFGRAWEVSDELLRRRRQGETGSRPRHAQMIWDGSALAGKRVLVRCHHGLGDTIQFARFLPMLRSRARSVALLCQTELVPLMTQSDVCRTVLPLHDGTPEVEYDVDVEIMELAHAFRASPQMVCRGVPYLRVEPPCLRRDRHLNVGLVWRTASRDIRHSVDLDLLAPLWSIEGVRYHAIQPGDAVTEWTPEHGPVAGSDDILAAAKAMLSLDLVISVDSMPAHLAGALGVPTITLLPAPAHWRWMSGRRSPWYPSMTLLRQKNPGEWEGAVAELVGSIDLMRRGAMGGLQE
jgi:hypothetical protein